MNKLCRVRQVQYEENMDLEVGSILARYGAWQRKYEVVAITEMEGMGENYKQYFVEVKSLGNYYASGREEPTPEKKQRHSEHIATRSFHDGKPTKLSLHGFLHVVPEGTKIRKLRVVK